MTGKWQDDCHQNYKHFYFTSHSVSLTTVASPQTQCHFSWRWKVLVPPEVSGHEELLSLGQLLALTLSLSLFRWPPLLMICHLMRALQQLLRYSCLVGPFLSLHKLCSDLIFQSFSFLSQNLCNHIWFMLNSFLIYALCRGLLSYTEVRAVQSFLKYRVCFVDSSCSIRVYTSIM